MGIFDRFPYSSTHEMNLDYMLGKATEIAEDMQQVTAGMEQVQAGLSAISEKTEQATQAAAAAAQSASSIEGSVTAAEEAAEEAQMHNESAQTWANNALTYKADCQRAATEAAASSSSAAQAATAAAASEDTVATYAQAANASAQSAANNNDSAHQYANQASASASNATFHSSNAQTAATNANTSATNAETAATNAQTAATRTAALKDDCETLHRMCAAAADRAATEAVNAANSAAQAAASKTDVENLVESLPEDFTDLNNHVNQLSDEIDAIKDFLPSESENMVNPALFIDGYKYGGYGNDITSPIEDENYVCFILTGLSQNDVLVFNTISVNIHQYNARGIITGILTPTLVNDVYKYTITVANDSVGISIKKDTLNMLMYLYIAKETNYNANGKKFKPYKGIKLNYPTMPGRHMHFSIDDVTLWADFIVNENTYTSIFDNQKLAILKNMHDNYGLCVTLNTFNVDQDGRSISDVPVKFASEFKENSNWLKFAFHASDANKRYNTEDETVADQYNTFTAGIVKLTGTANSIDRFTRLGFFTGTLNNVNAMKNSPMGVCGLLSPDNNIDCGYYMTPAQRDIINNTGHYFDSENGIMFLKSQARLEQLSMSNDSEVAQFDTVQYGEMTRYLEFFTHESLLINAYNKLIMLCNLMIKNGYEMIFTSDKLIDAMYAY